MEVWKSIEGFDGAFEVSNKGRICSNLRTKGHKLKPTADNKGYLRVRVTYKRVKYTLKVHREVAKAFIDNKKNLPQVNHIDGNKKNNHVENLEWVTNKENANHALNTGLWDSVIAGAKRHNNQIKKPVLAINLQTGEKRLFPSVSEAERQLGTRHVVDVIKGKRNSAKGFCFSYAQGGD